MGYFETIIQIVKEIVSANTNLLHKINKITKLLEMVNSYKNYYGESEDLNNLEEEVKYSATNLIILRQIEESCEAIDKKNELFQSLKIGEFDQNKIKDINDIKQFVDTFYEFYIKLIENKMEKSNKNNGINKDNHIQEINMINNNFTLLEYKYKIFSVEVLNLLKEKEKIDVYFDQVNIIANSDYDDEKSIDVKIETLTNLKNDLLIKLISIKEDSVIYKYINYIIDQINNAIWGFSLSGIVSNKQKRSENI